MKNTILYLLLLLSLPTFGQTDIYQSFEVDSVASPRGGVAYFNTFVQTSLRKPIAAQAAGTGGRVVVEGVVEPDGRISNVKALQKLRPDCDAEAVRIFNLFNAWKPGQKDGKAVRQRVTMPIMFPANTPFSYVNGNRITYFGADSKATTDTTAARYKQISPVDINGVPTGDVVVYELKGKGWKESFRLPLVNHQKTGSKAYTVGNQNYRQDWEGSLFRITNDGVIVSQVFYKDGKRVGPELTFHDNGSIAEKSEESDDRTAYMSWYANGQIRQIKSVPKTHTVSPDGPELVTAYWDSTGHMEVANGNGRATYRRSVTSENDTTQRTSFVEQGTYKDGWREGVWTGRYADGSYFYEELYDKGVCLFGKARSGGADTVRYTSVRQQPEFSGGLQGLGQFLSSNLSYPATAQKAGVQGRVYISFVVCTDGTLCDYEVLKGVQPDLDQEAVRVVKKMSGKWKPGYLRGQKVRVKYNLPINFSIQ